MAVTVKSTSLPEFSELSARMKDSDFLDCYAAPANISPRQAAEIITSFPDWVRFWLRIRRLVTTPFGLKNDGVIEATDKVGSFPVESESERELVAGFNDKHLDFRISVISDSGQVYLATWVRRHNIGGWIYLALIMPFHILIARDAVRRVARQGAMTG